MFLFFLYFWQQQQQQPTTTNLQAGGVQSEWTQWLSVVTLHWAAGEVLIILEQWQKSELCNHTPWYIPVPLEVW